MTTPEQYAQDHLHILGSILDTGFALTKAKPSYELWIEPETGAGHIQSYDIAKDAEAGTELNIEELIAYWASLDKTNGSGWTKPRPYIN